MSLNPQKLTTNNFLSSFVPLKYISQIHYLIKIIHRWQDKISNMSLWMMNHKQANRETHVNNSFKFQTIPYGQENMSSFRYLNIWGTTQTIQENVSFFLYYLQYNSSKNVITEKLPEIYQGYKWNPKINLLFYLIYIINTRETLLL